MSLNSRVRFNPSAVMYIIAGSLLTLSLGLYNNFPLLYADSATYLASGIELFIPWDRPVFYGLFLRACHMQDNLYFCMIVQSTLLASLLYLPFHLMKAEKIRGAWYLSTILILTLTTPWSFYANYLTADFFGMVLFICLWMLLFFNLSKTLTTLLCLLLSYSLLVHHSHFILFAGIVVVYFLIRKFKRWQPISTDRALSIVFSVLLFSIIVSTLVTRTMTKADPNGNGKYIFLTAKLNESGILHEFLKRKCESNAYPLCAYKDSLSGDFLWDPKSPMQKIGGLQADNAGYRRMLGDMVSDWRTIKRICVMSFNSTLQQLFTFETEPHHRENINYIKERFAVHRHDVDVSMQNRGYRLDLKPLNSRQWIVVLTSLVFLIVFLMHSSRVNPVVRVSILFALSFLLINAWVFGTFASIHSRFQGRVICLIPFMVIFFWPEIRQVLKSVFRRSVELEEDVDGS